MKPSTSGGSCRRGEHPAQAGEDHQAHDARLGQREDIAPVGRQRGWIGQFDGGHLARPIRAWRARGKALSAHVHPSSAMRPHDADSLAALRFRPAPPGPAAAAPAASATPSWCRSRSTPASAASSSRSTSRTRRSRPPTSSIMSTPTASTARPSTARCAVGDGGLIQGGVRSDARKLFPPIAHEPTRRPASTMSPARSSWRNAGPGTARADFFILASDIPRSTPTRRRRSRGFAVFGHVVEGMDVVKKILAAPVSPTKGEGAMKGQMLDPRSRSSRPSG